MAANRMKMGYQCGTVLPAPFGISPVKAGKAPDARKVFRGKAFKGLPANTRLRLPGTLPQALSMAPEYDVGGLPLFIGPAPSGLPGFGLRAEPAFALQRVDPGLVVPLTARHVVDALSVQADVALDTAFLRSIPRRGPPESCIRIAALHQQGNRHDDYPGCDPTAHDLHQRM